MQCARCGAENEADAGFCYRCGNKLTGDAASTGPTKLFNARDIPASTAGAARPYDEPGARVYDVPAVPANDQGYNAPSATNYAVPTYHVPQSSPGTGSLTQQSNNALLSMIFGLLSLFLYLVFFCVWLAPLASAAAIPAVILGNKARREIRAAQGRISGDSMALTGIITGWITIVLSILAVALFVLGLIGLFAFGSTLD